VIRTCLPICALALMFGCASRASDIDVDANPQQPRITVDTYTLVVEDMPAFLAPIMRDALVGALAARGATEVADGGDVEFRLVFTQLSLLAGELPPSDRSESTLSPEETTRFVPRVELLVRVRGTATPQRIGAISRVHSVSAGVYMHPRASIAIRHAFDVLLAGFLASAD